MTRGHMARVLASIEADDEGQKRNREGDDEEDRGEDKRQNFFFRRLVRSRGCHAADLFSVAPFIVLDVLWPNSYRRRTVHLHTN